MKKSLFLILSMFLVVVVKSQTTVTYAQRTSNYYTTFKDGGDYFNQGSYQVGMWANTGNNTVVAFRKFRTNASGASSSDRAMQVGDKFIVNLSATRAYGKIGFALLSSPSATSSWDDRENNYALSVNLDGPTYTGSDYGNWYIKYSGNDTSEANFGGQQGSKYTDLTFTMTLIAHDRMNVTITDGTNTANFYDVQLNTSDPITDFTIFMENDYNGSTHSDVYWGLGNSYNQFTLKNTGAISVGESDSSYTISSAIPNGLAANSSSISSTNSLTKKGSGTITLTASNTYSGSTTVSAGILQLDGSLANSDVSVDNGASMISNGPLSTINSLTVNLGGFVTVNPNKSLTITNTLTNYAGNSGLVIQSGGTKNGSLIFSSGSPAATVQRSIAGYSDDNHGWHFLASPVDNMAISGSDFVPGANDDLYAWDESTNTWLNYKVTSNNITNFANGQGYLVAYETSAIKSFTGTLNNADFSVSSLSKDHDGWHLLGNPFPSDLLWNNTPADWDTTHINSTAKIWVESSASYIDIHSGGTIPAMQGFMVQVTTGVGSLTIPLSDRTNSTTSWYKDEEANKIKLTVYDTEGNTAQESIVRIAEGSTAGFDTQYDSHFLKGYAPQFYSVVGNEHYSTNTIPQLTALSTIPFNFIKNTSSSFYIKAEGISSITTGEKVYLTDLKTNYTQFLNDNPVYYFTAEDGDVPARFELRFSALGISNNKTIQQYNVYAVNNTIEINADKSVNATVRVYNIAGQLLNTTQLANQSSTSINMSSFAGIAVVSIVSDKAVYNKKIIIK